MWLQYFLAVPVLRWGVGKTVLTCISKKVTSFLEFPKEGSDFVFGFLTTGINMSSYVGDLGGNVTDIQPAFVFGVSPNFSYTTLVIRSLGTSWVRRRVVRLRMEVFSRVL